MREKSKKTIKTRLLALLLVFCMTFQMISYSPGNVVRAEGEVTRYSGDIIKECKSTYKGDGTDPSEGSNAGAFSSVNISFSTPAGGYTSAEDADTLFKLKLKPDSAYLHQEWGKIPAEKQAEAATLLQDAMEADAANKDAKYKALSQYIDVNGELPEINFDYTFDTGFLWKKSSNPGITLENVHEVTTTIDGSEVTVGEYTFTQDSTTGALKLHFVFEPFVYGVTTAMAGMSFTLGLQDSLFEGGNPVEVKWDQVTSSLNVGEWRDPSLPDTLDDNYTIDKSVVNKVGETNSVGDAMYVDYKLDLTAENDGDLRGKIVEDLLPEGLTVDSVTLRLDGAAESGIESGTTPGDGTYQTVTESGRAGFSYQFPGGAPLQRASLTIRAILTVEQYTEFMESGTGKLWNFTNQAFLRDPAKDGPIAQTEEIKTDMEATFMTKDGTQRAYDGKYFDWEINVNTQFSHLSNAYIIDSISKNQHTYVDGEPIKITKESAAPVEMSLEKTTDTNLINKAYADLTNALLQNSDKVLLNSLETLTNNGNKAIYYESGDAQIMIIPFDKYENAKVKINYATLLKEPEKVTPSLNLSNKVKMIWSHYWYGNGIGKDDFNVDIDIDKGVAGNYDIVQKTADFQKDSGTMDWVFKINHYQKNAEDVRIVEDLKAQNMSLAAPADPSKNWTCKDQNGKTVTIHNSQSQGTPYYVYDNANEKLTFYFGNLTPDKYYELRLHTNVDGQMAQVTDDKSSVSNKATVLTKDNGADVEHTTEAKQDVDNTIIQKVNTGYDQAAHQVKWTITVNQNKLPITDGTVTDVFNTNDMTFLNVDAIRKDGAAFTLDKDSMTATKDGQTIAWTDAANPVFTFKDQKNDESVYEIDVTTQLTETFINAHLTTNAENNVVNTAVLRGYVKGMPIRDTKVADLTDNKVSDDATAPIGTTALNKHGEYNSGTQIITWTAAFNGGQADMKDRVITEDLSANPILELKHRDPKTGDLLTNPVKVYEGKWENGKIVKANDTPVIKDRSKFTDVADQGFKFTVPDKYATTILIFEFDTYITNSASSADVSNTINLEPLSGKDAGQEVSSGADGLDYFDIDEYASISVGPYIKVKKTSSSQDTSGKNQIKLGGATFTLTEYVADGASSDYDNAAWKPSSVADKTRITNDDGQASFVNLIPTAALYKLEETTAPGGYDIDATQDSTKVYYFRFVNKGAFEAGTSKHSNVSISNGTTSSNETVLEINRTVLKGFSFDRTNTPTGKLEFTKTDANGTGIQVVGFTLVRDDKKVKDQTATSDVNGKITFDKLDPGTYTLQETSAPDQYLLGGDRKVTVDENGTATIAAGEGLTGDTTAGYKISNEYVSGTIKINKVDSEKDTIKLPGAKFEIYSGEHDNKTDLKKDGSGKNYIGEATTDGNGTATFNNVPYSPGGYTIIESAPPKGYEVTTADKLITIQANAVVFEKNKNFTHTVADTVENTRLRYDVSLKKTNDNTPTAEALQKSFELTYTGNDSYDTWRDASNGVQIKDSKGSINRDNGKITVTTENDGELQLTNLPYGDYKLTETTNNQAENIYQNLELTISNDQLVVHETTALILTANGGTDTVVNKLKQANELKITKTDDKGDKLKDVTFTLTGKDAYGHNVNMTATTIEDGVASFTNIPIGEGSGATAYTLQETQIGQGTTAATDGYTTDFSKTYKVYVKPTANNGVAIEVKDSENQTVGVNNNGITITNEPVEGNIEFIKKDVDGRTLQGIEFELRRVVNGTVQTTDDMIYKAISGDNGTVHFKNIPYATYKLFETKGADGSKTKEFDITKAKLTVTNNGTETFKYGDLDLTNTLNKADVRLTKKDQNGTPLAGIEFKVERRGTVDENNNNGFVLNPVAGDTYTAYNDKDGNPMTVTSAADTGVLDVHNLVYGDYRLVESNTADLADTSKNIPVTFNVNENGVVENVKVYGEERKATGTSPYNIGDVNNTLRYGYVNLLKKNDDGVTLPGTVFEIYKVNADAQVGDFVKEVTTNHDGKIDPADLGTVLIYGDYILKEKAVHDSLESYYSIDTNSYTFTIGEDTTGNRGIAWISPGSENQIIYKKADESEPTAEQLKPIKNTAVRQPILLHKTTSIEDHHTLSGIAFGVYSGETLVAQLSESSTQGVYDVLDTENIDTVFEGTALRKTLDISVDGEAIQIPYVKNNTLLAGKYTIREILTNNSGIVENKESTTIEVSADGFAIDKTSNSGAQMEAGRIKLTNILKTAEIHLIKTDQNNTPLGAGIEFTLTRKGSGGGDEGFYLDNSKVPSDRQNQYFSYTAQPTVTTDEQGSMDMSSLPYGIYRLTEKSGLEDELKNPEQKAVVDFEIKDSNGQTVVVRDGKEITETAGSFDLGAVVNELKYGNVQVNKVFGEQNTNTFSDGVTVPKASFAIYQDTDGDGQYTNDIDALCMILTTNDKGQFDINPDGSYSVNGQHKWLLEGNYLLHETASTGESAYQMDTGYYSFEVKNDKTLILSNKEDANRFENTPYRGAVTLTKVNEEFTGTEGTALTIPLSGAEFEVRNGDKVVALFKEDPNTNGTYTIQPTADKAVNTLGVPYVYDGRLLMGTYTLYETKAPDGHAKPAEAVADLYISKDRNQDINEVVQDGKVNSVITNVTNKADITAQKLGEMTDDKELQTVQEAATPKAGFTFKLERVAEADGTTVPLFGCVKELTTGNDGRAVFENIPVGTYLLTEISGTDPSYVIPADNSQKITVKNDGKIEYGSTANPAVFKNMLKRGTISGVKIDTDTKQGVTYPVKGAVIGLFKDSQKVAEATTDENGAYRFDNIPYGSYTSKEITAPEGYVLNGSQTIDISITENGQEIMASAAIKNSPATGSLKLVKTNADGQKLSGAEFTLTGKNRYGDDITPIVKTTGTDGLAVFDSLTPGAYTLTETRQPAGYERLAESLDISVTVGQDNIIQASAVQNGEVLKPDENSQYTLVNQTAEIVFNKTGHTGELCANGDNADEILGASKPLEGAKFGLYTQDNQLIQETVSNAGGQVVFDHITPGTYLVRELEAPHCYKVDETVYQAVVDETGRFHGLKTADGSDVKDNTVLDDAVRGQIKLVKVDEQDPTKLLPGSTYGLYKRVEKTEPQSRSAFARFFRAAAQYEEVLVATAVTDEKGEILFDGLITGVEYIVKELAAPDGSQVSKKPITVKFKLERGSLEPDIESFDNGEGTAALDKDGNVVWYEPPIMVEVSKKDINEEMLSGAKLRITDENHQPIEGLKEWTSSSEAMLIKNQLHADKQYYLEEIEAPDGYTLAEPIPFKVTVKDVGPGENFTDKLVMTDVLTAFYISKTIINETNELPGAVLAVYNTAEDSSIARDEAGNEVIAQTITGESLSWTSGTEMKKIEGLKTGTYVLRETTAPDGYEVAEEITFTLMPDGTVTVGGEACEGNIVRMQDKPAEQTETPEVTTPQQPNTPEGSAGAATGIFGGNSGFWGIMAILAVAVLALCGTLVLRKKHR